MPGKPDESELIAPHPRRRRRRGDAAAEVAQEADRRRRRRLLEALDRRRGPSISRTGRSSRPTRPALPDGEERGLGPQPDRRASSSPSWKQRGLTPAPEADRRTLARRLSLDLTGLPPTPADVEAFVNDTSPDAYEKLVDQLLASPHWGEHRGRYWLDAARYADTHGIHFDNYREMWSYRDWVIDAFNRNHAVRPVHDRAARRRPAAEPRRSSSRSPRASTAATSRPTKAASIDEEYLVLYTRDRTETTSQVWLGLTAGCAVCHDHKFDPLSQKEFYALAAFFNNTTQAAMDGNIKDTPPIIVVPRPRTGRAGTRCEASSPRRAGRSTPARQAARPSSTSGWRRRKPDDVAAERADRRAASARAARRGQGQRRSTLDGRRQAARRRR